MGVSWQHINKHMHINKYIYIVLGEAKGHEGNTKKGHRIRHAVVQNAVLIPQSCPTLSDPVYSSLPGSSFHGLLQARILEWVATSCSMGSSWPRNQTWVSCIAGRFYTIWVTSEAPGNLFIKKQKTKNPSYGAVISWDSFKGHCSQVPISICNYPRHSRNSWAMPGLVLSTLYM